ncbi:MAG: manganese-binding transcriptional regulator MntR [Planctomycetota bacterium]
MADKAAQPGMGSKAPSPRRARNRYERTRGDHARERAEDYVELIADLIRETGEARVVDIARRLGVRQVTVTKGVARLRRDGLVTSAPYRSVFLTSEGKRLAEYARKRHEIVLDFLLSLGVPRRAAEADAEGVEHHLSRQTLQAMKRLVTARR